MGVIVRKSEQRIKAEQLVDRVLTMEESSENDAGWHGETVLGRFVEFEGQIPRGSGGPPPSKLYEATRLLRDWPERFLLARQIFNKLSAKQAYALRIDRSLRNRTKVVAIDPFNPEPEKRIEIHFNDQYIAKRLDITPTVLRRRIADGYKRLIELMEAQEQHDSKRQGTDDLRVSAGRSEGQRSPGD